MSNLFDIPSHTLKQEQPEKLDNLSPSKYGKAAFVQMTYTPSKLKENALYRETSTLKRVEESHSKVRQLEAENTMLMDKLSQIKVERDGIQESLTSQIQMYKKLLGECESKYQTRIKDLQIQFNAKMEQHIQDKEEEAKYAQSQKEALEDEIQRLRKIIEELNDRLSHSGNHNQELQARKEKLEEKCKFLEQNLEKMQKQKEDGQKKAKQDYERLSREKFESEVSLKQKMDERILEKDREIDSVKREHRQELGKIEAQRAADNQLKNQQVNEITKAFNAQTERLNKIVEEKEESNQQIQKELSQEKQKVLNLTRSYEAQINALVHQKNRYLSELDSMRKENDSLLLSLSDHRTAFDVEKSNLEAYINDLKRDADFSHLNYAKERDKNALLNTDLERQLVMLKEERFKMNKTSDENILLTRQTSNLKELLMESSSQLQKCKEEFLKMGRQRDILLVKLRELGHENDALFRIKQEREKESLQWRDAYYRSKAAY